MVQVTEEIQEAFKAQGVIPMATVNTAGTPNVVYVGMWWWEDDETLCVVNNYLRKTLENVESTGHAAFVCYGKSGSYQIKCTASNVTEGPLKDKAYKIATDRDKPYPGRSAVVCKVTEVYRASGGNGAGDKIA